MLLRHGTAFKVNNERTSGDVAAAVFLRTASGRSVKELRLGPLPADLDVYRPPREAMDIVRRDFENRGFKVFGDPQDLFLYLNGSRYLFAECFGIDEPIGGSAVEPPEELKKFVEEIVLLRSPELI
jgi:hypothetical protein